MGVPWSGAADTWSMALANKLVGNAASMAAIEITIGDFSARFLEDGRVGVQCEGVPAGNANCAAFATVANNESELRALLIAQNQNACGDGNIVSARFGTGNEVLVQCSSIAASGGVSCAAGTALVSVATNFVPFALAGGAALILGAAAAGGSSSTSDTR